MSPEAAASLQGAFDMISYFFIEDNGWTCYRTSPFISHFLYLAASMSPRFKHMFLLEASVDKIAMLKTALRMVNDRWLAAGRHMLR